MKRVSGDSLFRWCPLYLVCVIAGVFGSTRWANAVPPVWPPIQPLINACGMGDCVIQPGTYAGPATISTPKHLRLYGVTIESPSGQDGLIFKRTADYSSIEGGTISSYAPPPIMGSSVGLRQFAPRLFIQNVTIQRYGRNWTCESAAIGENANCNGTVAIRVRSNRSDLDGVLFSGGDANGITTIGLDVTQACWKMVPGWIEFLGSQSPNPKTLAGWQHKVTGAWVDVPAGTTLVPEDLYQRPKFCAGLNDGGFLGNVHIGPVVHQTMSGGLPVAQRRPWPSWTTQSDNAWSTVVNPYCEEDSADATPNPLTTVIGGNCNVAPSSGWLMRPGTPLSTPAKYGGQLILGGLVGSPRVRVGTTKVAPIVSTTADTWASGDIWIYNGVPPVGTCKINMVTVNPTTNAISLKCLSTP